MTVSAPRQAALVVGTTLFLVYATTLAPGVTLWDAGEFAAAVESLGIPHPPGTPLFILIARAWRTSLPFLATAVATNLLAAVCTAVSAAIAAALIARWTRDTLAAIAAGLVFGTMSTVWFNATETEVYSASLLLSMSMLWIASGTGTGNRESGTGPRHLFRFPVPGSPFPVPRSRFRNDLLLTYLFALAPPLHLSAMVAAPGAIALATIDSDLKLDVSRAVLLTGAAVLAVGVGTGSVAVAVIGVAILAARATVVASDRPRAVREASAVIAMVLIASTAFLFLLLRASLDPSINQGNPTTLAGVIDVIARRQYDVPGLWPRRAPFWLQVGNLFQYLDWQFALGLDRAVGASWWRTPLTPLFLALGIVGSLAHRRRDPRTWAAMMVLVSTATFGVVVYLNLRAGPSYGFGVLPPDADREARERDYFFMLGFAAFGAWVGQGAIAAARALGRHIRRRRLGPLGLAVAVVPIALNWRAADRRRQPAASLPNAFARATLESMPADAVLFVAGDNDTYPLWYAQVVQRVRNDVTIVTVPLLGASWYRAELARRAGLYAPADTSGWRGVAGELAAIAGHADRRGRPVLAAVALEPRNRAALGDDWAFRGLAYLRRPASDLGGSPTIDVPAVDSSVARVSSLFVGSVDIERVDEPAARYLTSLLMCPSLAKSAAVGSAADSARLLASRCNFR